MQQQRAKGAGTYQKLPALLGAHTGPDGSDVQRYSRQIDRSPLDSSEADLKEMAQKPVQSAGSAQLASLPSSLPSPCLQVVYDKAGT